MKELNVTIVTRYVVLSNSVRDFGLMLENVPSLQMMTQMIQKVYTYLKNITEIFKTKSRQKILSQFEETWRDLIGPLTLIRT